MLNDPVEPIEHVLAAYKDSNVATLAVHCETIMRIMFLKDEANHLQHPKFFVKSLISYLKAIEQTDKTATLLKNLGD